MAGHVYLIGSRKLRWYKIGKSSNAAIRISDLGILLPFKIEVIAVWKAENHHTLESLLHQKYEAQRINGEWFSFTDDQLNSLIAGMICVQTEIASTFSNIEKDLIPRRVSQKHAGSSFNNRIGKLVKENARLKEEIKSLYNELKK